MRDVKGKHFKNGEGFMGLFMEKYISAIRLFFNIEKTLRILMNLSSVAPNNFIHSNSLSAILYINMGVKLTPIAFLSHIGFSGHSGETQLPKSKLSQAKKSG